MDVEQLSAQLSSAIEKTTWQVTAEQQQKLISFLQLLHKWNKAYNLTSVRDPEQMLIVHILDSIAIYQDLDQERYIDVGTGPGLPGIPLAIMCPDKHFVLLDSLGKRVRFMKQVKFELGLENIEPVQSRVQDYHPNELFDGVLSRAFASLEDMLHWCSHLVNCEGEFLALKGQMPQEEIAQLSANYKILAKKSLFVPGLNAERHLIRIIKNA